LKRWEQGRSTIDRLLAERRLQRVSASREHADAMLAQARRYVASARLVAPTDPDAGFVLAYDAARKALTAVLETQALRPTSRGGHIALIDAVMAQLDPPLGRSSRDPWTPSWRGLPDGDAKTQGGVLAAGGGEPDRGQCLDLLRVLVVLAPFIDHLADVCIEDHTCVLRVRYGEAVRIRSAEWVCAVGGAPDGGGVVTDDDPVAGLLHSGRPAK